MGKEIGRSYKYYRTKISNPTLKKPVLSSLANHTSYTTNLTPTIMSYKLEHKDSTSIQTHGGYLKYRLYPLLCNTQKTEYQCSGHIYTPLFDTIDHYFTSFTC